MRIGLVLVGLACGCGASKASHPPAANTAGAGTGGTSGLSGSAGLGGATGVGGIGIGGGAPADPRPKAGECIVVGEWKVTHPLAGVEMKVHRLQDGFALRINDLDWYVTGESDDAWRVFSLSLEPISRLLGSTVLGTAEEPRFLVVRGDTPIGYEGTAVVSVFGADGQPVGAEVPVLEIFDRATSTNVLAVSFSRQIAAFGNYHPSTRTPHVVLIGADGHPLGEPLNLVDNAVDCFSLTETDDGFLASFLDETTRLVHLTALDSAGQVTNASEWPMPDGHVCSEFWREATGLFARFVMRNELGEDVSTEIYRYEAGALEHVISLPIGQGWLLDGPSPLVGHSMDGRTAFGRVHDGTLVPFESPELPYITDRLPAVDGRLFLVGQGERTTTNDGATEVLELMEIECGDVPAVP